MPTYQVNDDAVTHARHLIDRGGSACPHRDFRQITHAALIHAEQRRRRRHDAAETHDDVEKAADDLLVPRRQARPARRHLPRADQQDAVPLR